MIVRCRIILILLILQIFCIELMSSPSLSVVRVHFDVKSLVGPKKLLSFCINCDNPEAEGSYVPALTPKFSSYTLLNSNPATIEDTISGDLLYCVPNFSEKDRILNAHEFENRVVLVDRGVVPMLDKVKRIQQAGAVGIVIADDGSCDELFRQCGYRIGSLQEGGFSAHDDDKEWKKIVIPVFLISKSSGTKIKSFMTNQLTVIKGAGKHFITKLSNDNEL